MTLDETPRPRLLVVDDDPLSQRLTEVMLRGWPVEVCCFSSGEEVLIWMADHGCDLILLDMYMAGLDGYETCRRVRAMERGRGGVAVPIIALTGHASSADRQAALDAGMNDHLDKPLRMHKLYNLLRSWLPQLAHWPVPGGSGAMELAASWGGESRVGEILEFEVLERLRVGLSRVPGGFVRIVDLFLADAPFQLVRLRQFCVQQEAEPVQQIAHALKSQCGALGAVALQALFDQLEYQAAHVGLQGTLELLDQADTQWSVLHPLLLKVRNSCDAPVDPPV
ncbi:MAG: response regulator [Magnetococcales bacterium]|nr:response regulator [Magnetococcales bacterium]